MRRMLEGIGLIAAVTALTIFGLLVFGNAQPPKALLGSAGTLQNLQEDGLPSRQSFTARDGSNLSYRLYPAGSEQIAVLLHGADATSSDMNVLAKALQKCEITVYVLDMRGMVRAIPMGMSQILDSSTTIWLMSLLPKNQKVIRRAGR